MREREFEQVLISNSELLFSSLNSTRRLDDKGHDTCAPPQWPHDTWHEARR